MRRKAGIAVRNGARHWGSTGVLVIGLLAGNLPVGAAPADNPAVGEVEQAYDELELFTRALFHIRRQYVEERSYQELVHGSLKGLLNSLDEHSSFLDEEDYTEIKEETSGQYGGIGIHVGMRDDQLTVIAPIEGTPAFRAGLLSGDRIIEIGGTSTRGMSLRDAVKLLRGKPGEKVTLGIRREAAAPFSVELERADIEVPSVVGGRMLADGIGYVRVTQFSAKTGNELYTALRGLESNGMAGVVLDLRVNPGGLLSAAVDVASLFLDKGQVIVSTRGRDRKQDREDLCTQDGRFCGLQTVILLNEGSASASEIVAGALHDNRRAVLIGATSYGKGSVQSVIPIDEKRSCALRMTTALYYTPSGRQIHEKGIEPDIPVYMAAAEWPRVLEKRMALEQPGPGAAADAAPAAQALLEVDRPLRRAVDLLQALRMLK